MTIPWTASSSDCLRRTATTYCARRMRGLRGSPIPSISVMPLKTHRVLLTHNYDDFADLHELVAETGGHHPGILAVRRDNDPRRDLSRRGIVGAIRKLLQAGVVLPDGLHILNQWR